MMLIVAIEHSNIHRRMALKLLLIFGCSHYRLSFLIFFTSMILSMWVSNVLACGIMMPIVKAILAELETMGILEVYHPIRKSNRRNSYQEQSPPRPTEFTIFYFLGIAYSSSIGSMATIMGSQANQIFKIYCETIFPIGPKIEFPHFMLLNLPGVLVMETMLYMWLNFYFLGMFRAQSEIALEIGLTEEEAQYINTLLDTQFKQLGRIKFHEVIVGTLVALAAILQPTITASRIENYDLKLHNHLIISSPCFICVVLLFIIPREISILKLFKRRRHSGGSSALFQSLKDSSMTDEFGKFLTLFKSWPSSAIILVIIIFCKILTEFASNSTVVYCMLPSIAKFSFICHVNPHYFMLASTLISSLPFHLVTGAPINALVCAYMHIPPWKMMYVGIGPSVIGIVVTWFTVSAWSTAIWPDISHDPDWANVSIFNRNITT
ncbi:hypothetical protein K1T71_011472 [Dendrolimus kikuchii]|uniref:Uncharacterized protein n=1 Tax=Dendrolimus kikuchii TaxID=765133 RepID=A0ACC1CNY0_9NEOP|nr:hypothetical protein K1T71_011472 [Dendrolimus kikuchii]